MKNRTLRLFITLFLSLAMFLNGCSLFKLSDDILAITENGAVRKSESVDIPFERIAYGAGIIEKEDEELFYGFNTYMYPQLIQTQEEWEKIQKVLKVELPDVDFDEYVVFGAYTYSISDTIPCIAILIYRMNYSDKTLFYGWRPAFTRRFVQEDRNDLICGFDLVKIKKDDFPMEKRGVLGASLENEPLEDNTGIWVPSKGSVILYNGAE